MAEIISSVTSAITIVKNLNALNDKIKNAEFKGMLADLSIELAEVKIRLADVLNENGDLKRQLENTQKPQFPACPSCGHATWRVERSFSDPLMGEVGAMRRVMTCSACKFSEEILYVPE